MLCCLTWWVHKAHSPQPSAKSRSAGSRRGMGQDTARHRYPGGNSEGVPTLGIECEPQEEEPPNEPTELPVVTLNAVTVLLRCVPLRTRVRERSTWSWRPGCTFRKRETYIYIYIYINRRLGVWYSRETTPEPGNRFRLRLRCVRACEAACA